MSDRQRDDIPPEIFEVVVDLELNPRLLCKTMRHVRRSNFSPRGLKRRVLIRQSLQGRNSAS